MSPDERIDFSSLDPAREPARWQAVVAATLRRAEAVLQERRRAQDPLNLIAQWMRPVLLAAAFVLALLLPLELRLELEERQRQPARRLASLSVEWAAGAPPSRAVLLAALGGGAR